MTVSTDCVCLDARGVCAGYGARQVLDRVDLRVRPGVLTALIGPNGCGKSTLLRVLGRLMRPQDGEVRFGDRPLADWPTRELARRLALLPQGPVAPEGLTVRELVAQGRHPHTSLWSPWSEADTQAVHAALERTGLAGLADRPLDALSGGQRQRAWIAMVLAQETDILLLDEPTTFLDLQAQIEIMGCLRRVTTSGRTVVVVMHEINVAAAFADHLVMMRDGRILAEGTPGEVVTPARLARVFDLDARVMADPSTGRPVCVPVLAA